MGLDIVGHRTMRDLLIERERRHPDKPFLVFADAAGAVTELSYREFADRVRAAAAGFAATGIAKGDKVVVHLPNCPEFLYCWFGLAWIGAVLVPSNTANTATELRHVVGFSDAIAVLTSTPYAALLDTVAAESPAVRTRIMARSATPGWRSFEELMNTAAEPPDVDLSPDDLAELIFTSGTTALPKAVMLTHANCLAAGERECRTLCLDAPDRFLTALPLFHVNAQSITVLATLTVGGTCLVLEEYRASRFWRQLRELGATAVSLVAMQVRTLLAQPSHVDDRNHALRRVMYAINVLDDEKAEFERRFGVELVNGYGLSEAMTLVTIAPVHGAKRWPSIGLPAPDRRIRLVDDAGRDVPPGQVGEIIVAGVPGRTLMAGYYKDPDATAAAIRDGWLHTGDNGYVDDAGYLYFFDRRKDVIKRAGENVSASEVERVLLTHPDIAEAAVIGVPDPVRDEAVLAFVVPTGSTVDLSVNAVLAHCAEHLAAFKVPTMVEIRDQLPKTSIGKIEKRLLRRDARELTR